MDFEWCEWIVYISSSGINFDMGLNLYFCITSSCMSPTKVHSNHTLGSVARASLMLFVGDTETKCSTSFPPFQAVDNRIF